VTYSIIAFDPETGECGVAVQSHYFSTGAIVPWAEPGIGAVATQASVDIAYGPRGLERMRTGQTAPEALAGLVAEDPLRHVRQVAMLDVHGGIGCHTGSECMAFAGQVIGPHHSCQANLMRSGEVWDAMSDAYLGAGGPLAERLLEALDAGEAAGGDLRGRQSAAVLVVPAEGEAWERSVELRVEDHEDPLGELRRLWGLDTSYRMLREADVVFAAGDERRSAEIYVEAWQRVPDNHELQFWAGLAMVELGEEERAGELLRQAIDAHGEWRLVIDMLTEEMSPSIATTRRILGDYGAAGGAGPT
jgi:uncharacterized Ntn-hydrolase superfamily protein